MATPAIVASNDVHSDECGIYFSTGKALGCKGSSPDQPLCSGMQSLYKTHLYISLWAYSAAKSWPVRFSTALLVTSSIQVAGL